MGNITTTSNAILMSLLFSGDDDDEDNDDPERESQFCGVTPLTIDNLKYDETGVDMSYNTAVNTHPPPQP